MEHIGWAISSLQKKCYLDICLKRAQYFESTGVTVMGRKTKVKH